MSRQVLKIAFSAFFADVGYQAVQAIFPIYLVFTLSTNAFYFGLANALAYGGGALFAYSAGLLGKKHSRKWLAVLGSAFILLMPLVGLTINPLLAIALFAMGWWARNFRVPPRRAMLTEASRKENLGKVFGFLHTLDIGGGVISIVILLLLLSKGVNQHSILLLAAIPLIISTFLLLITTDVRKRNRDAPLKAGNGNRIRAGKDTYRGIMVATALYGFSYYSLGFPILTIAKSAGVLSGIGSYGVYLGVSAITGYYIGSRKRLNKIKALGYLGYILSGIGTGMLALGYAINGGIGVYYFGIALMGFGLGVVETMEPTIISLMRRIVGLDKGMGSLQGSRSLGLFFANLIMGILYVANPSYAYLYAALVSVAAGILVLSAGRDFVA